MQMLQGCRLRLLSLVSAERQSERTVAEGGRMKSNWKASGRLPLHVLFDFWQSLNLMQRWLTVTAVVWMLIVIVHVLLLIKIIYKAI
jgi:hypothetical protein